MKPQDIVFIVILAILLFVIRKPKVLVIAGLICLILSIPLFSFWIFFTAQRLVYYAAAFFLAATVIYLFEARKK